MMKWSASWEHWYRRALPAYCVYHFCMMHFPRPQLPRQIGSDVFAHTLAYGVLALLLWKCAETIKRPLSGRFCWYALLGLASYGVMDEYLQGFVNRGPSVGDWLSDVVGTSVVLAALELWRRWQIARRKREAIGNVP